jgi:1-deoxy-D-xylulose-5-phosphate synthase
MPERGEVLEIGKGRVLQEGTDVAFLSFGAHLAEVEAAARLLEKDGVSVTIADARFAKPLDIDLIVKLARTHEALITVEQGSRGGFGAMVLHELADRGALDRGLKIRTMTLPDRFIDQASPDEMYADAGMTRFDLYKMAVSLTSSDGKVVPLSKGA